MRHRPNILFLMAGAVLVAIGVAFMVAGLVWAVGAVGAVTVDAPQPGDLGLRPDPRGDLAPLLDGFTVFVIGCTVMTVGRYLWRGARKRGWRDRVGRLMIIIGYLLVGAAVCVLARSGLSALGEADMEVSVQELVRGLIISSAIAIPGAVLTMRGLRLAREEVLMEADVNAGF
jgi:hypothetical protein